EVLSTGNSRASVNSLPDFRPVEIVQTGFCQPGTMSQKNGRKSRLAAAANQIEWRAAAARRREHNTIAPASASTMKLFKDASSRNCAPLADAFDIIGINGDISAALRFCFVDNLLQFVQFGLGKLRVGVFEQRGHCLGDRSLKKSRDESLERGAAGGIPREAGQVNVARAFPAMFDVPLIRSEEHTYELQSPYELVCRLLLEK